MGVAVLAGPVAAPGQIARTEFSEFEEDASAAVERSLRFLDAAQRDDGTFAGAHGKSTGIVSLVGMTFLSKGYTPISGPFAHRINRCIDYVLEHADDDGVLDAGDGGNGPMYAHTISTLFLSEVAGMLDPERQARVHEVLAKANNAIIRAQAVRKDDRHQGGWRYRVDAMDSDLSCSGWALMALKSARLNGAPVPDQVISEAVGYIFKNHSERTGTFGYQDEHGHAETLTGAGLLCLELSGFHGHESTLKAGDYILEQLGKLDGGQHEYYGNYYNAQGMFQLGGRHWERYANWMYPHYLPKQKSNGAWEGRLGEVYSTSMVVLAFTVPYRQLPIYQRDETVDELEEG
ncbi:terpene cyclase/mutase family protein [soil metagenome]